MPHREGKPVPSALRGSLARAWAEVQRSSSAGARIRPGGTRKNEDELAAMEAVRCAALHSTLLHLAGAKLAWHGADASATTLAAAAAATAATAAASAARAGVTKLARPASAARPVL